MSYLKYTKHCFSNLTFNNPLNSLSLLWYRNYFFWTEDITKAEQLAQVHPTIRIKAKSIQGCLSSKSVLFSFHLMIHLNDKLKNCRICFFHLVGIKISNKIGSLEGCPQAVRWPGDNYKLKEDYRTSLMVQWLRICLPMHGTWVQSLVQKIPHATEELSLCATTVEPMIHKYWAHVPRACSAIR